MRVEITAKRRVSSVVIGKLRGFDVRKDGQRPGSLGPLPEEQPDPSTTFGRSGSDE
jgi:hypothetical protein